MKMQNKMLIDKTICYTFHFFLFEINVCANPIQGEGCTAERGDWKWRSLSWDMPIIGIEKCWNWKVSLQEDKTA